MKNPQFIACTHAAHAEPILAILNDAIVNSTALYDYQPRSLEPRNGSWTYLPVP